jgi:hypothetical protein
LANLIFDLPPGPSKLEKVVAPGATTINWGPLPKF